MRVRRAKRREAGSGVAFDVEPVILARSNYSCHLGEDAGFLLIPPHNQIIKAETLTFADRPELRIDPTTPF